MSRDPIFNRFTIEQDIALEQLFFAKEEVSAGAINAVKIDRYAILGDESKEKNRSLLTSFVKIYNKYNELSIVLSLNEKEEVLWEYNIIHDKKSNIVECKCFDHYSFLREMIFYLLDVNGKLLIKRCFDENFNLLWESYPNSQRDLCLFDIKYYYNQSGEMIESHEISPAGSRCITSYEYQYDDRGNWIKRIERVLPLNITTAITKRLIQYL